MAESTAGGTAPPGATRGVQTLRGDPRRAVRRLAAPTIVAMSAHTLYNLADAVWVARLGADALAAVGLFFPFFFVAMALSNGIGVGGSSAVSRFVGAGDREATCNVATHTIVLMTATAALFTVPAIVLARPLFDALGAGSALALTVTYSRIMFGGTILVFFTHVAMGLLRGEGNATRPMVAMVSGSVLNIVLDPLFIFSSVGPLPGLGLGIAGAALASVASMGITSAFLFFWLFFARDTYARVRFRGFRFRRAVIRDIFRVGLPASVQHMAMAVMMIVFNGMLVTVGGTDGVAVFSAGWRAMMVAVLPILGLTMAVVAVGGAAYGMGDRERLRVSYLHAIHLGLAVELVMLVAVVALAPSIARLFSSAEGSRHLYGDLVVLLRTVPFFLPAVPFGMCSSGLFQGTGRGVPALLLTLLRTIVLAVPLGYGIGVVWLHSLWGIYVGLVLANLIGGAVAFLWARSWIQGMTRLGVEERFRA